MVETMVVDTLQEDQEAMEMETEMETVDSVETVDQATAAILQAVPTEEATAVILPVVQVTEETVSLDQTQS